MEVFSEMSVSTSQKELITSLLSTLKFLLYVLVLMPVQQYITFSPKTGTYNRSFRIDLSGPILRSQLMVVFSGICKYKPGYVSHDLL